MATKKQTLADYLQRQQALRNPNRYQGLSETQRQTIEYFDAKKKKVGILLNDIMYQVKKSLQSPEDYSKIEKMIKAASEQIKTQFQNTKKFTQKKPKAQVTQLDTQTDLSRISLPEKIETKKFEDKVLKESNKIMQVPVKQETDKAKMTQGAKENSNHRDVKSRAYLGHGK